MIEFRWLVYIKGLSFGFESAKDLPKPWWQPELFNTKKQTDLICLNKLQHKDISNTENLMTEVVAIIIPLVPVGGNKRFKITVTC